MTEKATILVAVVDARGVFQGVADIDPESTAQPLAVTELPPDLAAPPEAWVRRDKHWVRRVALLDEREVYQGIVELEAGERMSERHLPQIAACDLPIGLHRWKVDAENPMGGAFEPLPRGQRAKAGRPSMEMAIGFDLLSRHRSLPEVTLAWLDDLVRSIDFASHRDAPLVASYAAARGIDFAKKED